ncbi:MAG: CGNR zinc finger domain-containing protein [Labedaea sp.]
MQYEDYIGNLARLAVEVVNTGSTDHLSGLNAAMLTEHHIAHPTAVDLAPLLRLLRPAVAAVADHTPPEPINHLLHRYPPQLQISTHDGQAHLHHAADGTPPAQWLGQSCAAALAHIACGAPAVTIARCQAANCRNFFVDQSRNRTRRYCSNTCASRTTVAAHRARQSSSPAPGSER